MSNGEFVIEPGQTRKISLTTSSGTGFVWMLSELPSSTWLEAIEDSSASTPGGTGTRTFLLYGASPGSGLLVFKLARPWEPLKVADERTYRVHVQPGHTYPVYPLYAAALQEARNSGDTARMIQLERLAEAQLGSSAEIGRALADLKTEISHRSGLVGTSSQALYAGAIHEAVRSGDLQRMKSLSSRAAGAEHDPQVASLLPYLRSEIRNLEQHRGMPVTPYGVAIHEAIASGDPDRMRRAEADAQSYLQTIQGDLESLRAEISRGRGSVVPLYAASIQDALASGDLVRMRSVANQADSTPNLPPEAQAALRELHAHLSHANAAVPQA